MPHQRTIRSTYMNLQMQLSQLTRHINIAVTGISTQPYWLQLEGLQQRRPNSNFITKSLYSACRTRWVFAVSRRQINHWQLLQFFGNLRHRIFLVAFSIGSVSLRSLALASLHRSQGWLVWFYHTNTVRLPLYALPGAFFLCASDNLCSRGLCMRGFKCLS